MIVLRRSDGHCILQNFHHAWVCIHVARSVTWTDGGKADRNILQVKRSEWPGSTSCTGTSPWPVPVAIYSRRLGTTHVLHTQQQQHLLSQLQIFNLDDEDSLMQT